jgi:hypothetical protein
MLNLPWHYAGMLTTPLSKKHCRDSQPSFKCVYPRLTVSGEELIAQYIRLPYASVRENAARPITKMDIRWIKDDLVYAGEPFALPHPAALLSGL